MAYKKKSWQEKLHNGRQPQVEVVGARFADIPAGASMVVVTPVEVDAYIRNIPHGVHTSLLRMRQDLAAAYHAAYCCPVTAGIFLRIVAEAAYEEWQGGKPLSDVAPFWRMIDRKAPVLKKLTFGAEFVLDRRREEGLPI